MNISDVPEALNSTKACRNSKRESRATPWSRGERKSVKTSVRMTLPTPPASRAVCCLRATDVSRCNVNWAMCRSDSDRRGAISRSMAWSNSGFNAVLQQKSTTFIHWSSYLLTIIIKIIIKKKMIIIIISKNNKNNYYFKKNNDLKNNNYNFKK